MLPKSCDRTAAYLDMRKAYQSRLRDVNLSELSLYGTGADVVPMPSVPSVLRRKHCERCGPDDEERLRMELPSRCPPKKPNRKRLNQKSKRRRNACHRRPHATMFCP